MAELKTRAVVPMKKDEQGILLPFETAKYRYKVIRPDQPLGIQRWTEYEKLKIVLGAGKTFSAIIEAVEQVERLLGSDKPLAEVRVDAILTLNALRRGMVELSQARYNQAFYLASIFIYREGDDPLTWDIGRATEYIDDWAEEGLSEQDFFSFALATVSGFGEMYQRLKGQMREQEAALSAISTLTGKAESLS